MNHYREPRWWSYIGFVAVALLIVLVFWWFS
jgi:hypothetical protein